MPRKHLLSVALAATLGAATAPFASPAAAQAAPTPLVDLQVPAQPLSAALAELSRQTGVQVFASGDAVARARSRAVSGRMSVSQALAEMLAGTGLGATPTANGGFAVHEGAGPTQAPATLTPVRVRGESDRETATSHVEGYVARRSATATKTDTPLIETPQSVTVVTADFAEAIGATSLKDALGYTPGVDIAANGADSRFDWLTLRGFDAYSPGFYLDNLPLRNIGTWGVWQTDTYGAERIELMRGPASVLYGQGGPGGVVNIVSKRPTAEAQKELQVQLGDPARYQVAGDFAGPVDAEGRVLYRVTALVREGELPAGDMDDDRVFIAPSLTWRPTNDTTLTLLAHAIHGRAGVYSRGLRAAGSLVPTAAGTFVPTDTFTGEPDYNRLAQDQWAVGYELEHRLDDTFTLRQNARYGHLDTDLRQVQGGGYVTVDTANPANPANFRTVRRNVFTSQEDVGSFVIDNQLQARVAAGDWRHTLLVGLDWQHTRVDQVTGFGAGPTLNLYEPVYGAPVTSPAPYVDGLSTVKQAGLYVQDQIKWTDRWSITLGGRYDRATATVDSRLDGTHVRMPDEAFTGRAGVVYLMPNGLAPYASYTESFTPTATIDTVTGEPLDPETGRQYEAGLRYQPPGRKENYSVAVFDLRRRNYVTNDAQNRPRQTGEVVVRGLELEAAVQPVKALNVVGAYGWTPKAEVTASSNPDEIGKQLIATPEHRVSLWADYRFDFGLKLGAGARYTGSNHGNGEAVPAKVPAYTLFDLMAGYELDRWQLALNVRNLGDKTYIANCDAYGSCYFGDPRKVIATATYRW
ncbi:TonB-dependent siderophore receptor [Piscinibacter gummiphilus]|nr:TonB-dependent siderophore receptor [Piscinibacter gummiphilus]